MNVVFVPASGGEVLAGPNRIRILEDGSNTGHRIGFIEARLPPGIGGPHSLSTSTASTRRRLTWYPERCALPQPTSPSTLPQADW